MSGCRLAVEAPAYSDANSRHHGGVQDAGQAFRQEVRHPITNHPPHVLTDHSHVRKGAGVIHCTMGLSAARITFIHLSGAGWPRQEHRQDASGGEMRSPESLPMMQDVAAHSRRHCVGQHLLRCGYVFVDQCGGEPR